MNGRLTPRVLNSIPCRDYLVASKGATSDTALLSHPDGLLADAVLGRQLGLDWERS